LTFTQPDIRSSIFIASNTNKQTNTLFDNYVKESDKGRRHTAVNSNCIAALHLRTVKMLNRITQQIRKQTRTMVTVGTLSLLLSACGGSNSSPTPTPQTTPTPQPTPTPVELPTTGIWNAAAYGLVMDVKDTSHTWYQVSGEYCQKFNMDIMVDYNHADLLASMAVSDSQQSVVSTIAGKKVPGMLMLKQAALPDACADNLIARAGEVGYTFDAQRDFEIFWQTFEQHYAFFDIENVDWTAAYQQANAQIGQDTTEEQLFGILSQMITPLKDFHVVLVNPQLEMEYAVSRKVNVEQIALTEFVTINGLELPLTEAQNDIADEYFELQMDAQLNAILGHIGDNEAVKSNASNTIGWFKTAENMGCVILRTMDLAEIGDEATRAFNMVALHETLNQIMTDFDGLSGLILDVRTNNGGDDFVSQAIVSHLIDQDLPAYAKQARLGDERTQAQQIVISPNEGARFSGPVAVLTSASTSSAGEVFSIAMRARPNTVLVGEETAGGFSDQLPKTLPHGLFFTLSNEIYIAPDGQEFEGSGVPVDIQSAFFTLEQREAGVDLGLDKATEWLLSL
jgi:carboxyl-terminal processing protease